MKITPVPFDREIQAVIDSMPFAPDSPPLSNESIVASRAGMAGMIPPTADVIGDRAIDVEERTIPGPDGAPDLEVTILRPRGSSGALPAVYNIHGGGMTMGTRAMDTPRLADLVDGLGVVAVNVEYRLAPENPFPAGVEDCYAGFVWVARNAAELGIDPDRIVVMGGSAGGGLSAAVSLLARDRKGPTIAGQLLLCPMLDDTNTTASSLQYDGIGTWTRHANLVCWRALLGDAVATDDVSPYAAPARAQDLSGLPPAFIEAGAAEAFRDEDVSFATRIWEVGGDAELHIWDGGCHGFDIYAPESAIAKAALASRNTWLRKVLSLPSE